MSYTAKPISHKEALKLQRDEIDRAMKDKKEFDLDANNPLLSESSRSAAKMFRDDADRYAETNKKVLSAMLPNMLKTKKLKDAVIKLVNALLKVR